MRTCNPEYCVDTNRSFETEVEATVLYTAVQHSIRSRLIVFSQIALTAVLLLSCSLVSAQAVEIGSGTVDSTRNIAPKWRRVNLDPLTSGEHIIRLDWGSDADLRFSLNEVSTGNRLATIDSSSPSEWVGTRQFHYCSDRKPLNNCFDGYLVGNDLPKCRLRQRSLILPKLNVKVLI